jgi:hypothetical protein
MLIEGLGLLFFLCFLLVLLLSLQGCGGGEDAGEGGRAEMEANSRRAAERICQAYAECIDSHPPDCARQEMHRAALLYGPDDPGMGEKMLTECAACYIERGCAAWGANGWPVPECMDACSY